MVGIHKTCSLSVEGAQLAPEAFFYSPDNTYGYIVMPTIPCEGEVIQQCTNPVLEEMPQASKRMDKLEHKGKLPCLGHSSFTLLQREAGETRPPLTRVAHLYACEMLN